MLRRNQSLPLFALSLLLGMLVGGHNAVGRHPFHSSLAEMEWNAKSHAFEVALSVWPVDLEQVLRRSDKIKKQLESPINLDDESQHPLLDKSIRDYVAAKLHAHLPDDEQLKMEWLGFEVERDAVWCYFELKVPTPTPETENREPATNRQVEFENQLFFELQPDQQNTILFRHQGKRQAIHFVERHPRQALEWSPSVDPSK